MAKTKEPVRLRMRPTRTGNTSLYLDTYFQGERQTESLHLYLIPEKTKADREHNSETMSLAEAVLAKRLVEFRNGQFGFRNQRDDVLLVPYMTEVMERRHISEGSRDQWTASVNWVRRYDQGKTTLRNVTRKWCTDFQNYLLSKRLTARTVNIHLSRIATTMDAAMQEDLVERNHARGLKRIPERDAERAYLTVDELRRLVAAPCGNERVRQTFLFACFTGLRWSDVKALRWSDVSRQGEFTRLTFRQKKTGGQMYLDISEQAARLMGERPEKDGPVFDMTCDRIVTAHLRKWAAAAGIDKELTFHSGRHTFATMMLDLGTDLYTVSKLLGHTDVKTTQIYAKILDKNRQAAVARIPDIMGGK